MEFRMLVSLGFRMSTYSCSTLSDPNRTAAGRFNDDELRMVNISSTTATWPTPTAPIRLGLRASDGLRNSYRRTTEFQTGGTLGSLSSDRAESKHPALVATTSQAVTGAAAFDSDNNGSLDTARNQRIDVLTATGPGVGRRCESSVSNATGGFARVDEDQTVIFEFAERFDRWQLSNIQSLTTASTATPSASTTTTIAMTDRTIIPFVTSAAGSTDHSLDFGFVEARVDLELQKFSQQKFSVEGETVSFVITVTNDQANRGSTCNRYRRYRQYPVRPDVRSGIRRQLRRERSTAQRGHFPNALAPGAICDAAIFHDRERCDCRNRADQFRTNHIAVNEIDVDSTPK